MFKRAFLYFLSVVLVVAYAVYWNDIRPHADTLAIYRKLNQESIDLHARKALQDLPIEQIRQEVRKDIWTDQQTRHFSIQSEQSHLILTQRKNGMEGTETLQKLKLTQDLYQLTADEGVYLYPSHQFTAQHNCHLFNEENLIDGTAIHFDLAQQIITYQNPKGKLSDHFLFSANQLIWDKKKGEIHLKDQVTIEEPQRFTVQGDRALLCLNQLSPEQLTLQGNIRLLSTVLQNKKTYALAETLIYNPLSKTLLFTSPKKVLFWQEDLTLSASEVFIRQDQTIEGRGNVHFTFDVEEQNSLQTLFQQYL